MPAFPERSAHHAYASDRGAFKSAYAAQDVNLDTDPQVSILAGGTFGVCGK